ncbi:hypothetical protein [Yanshouia hominis]|uniref:Uncharacterized protein n=1 Tax=Yanshouia hominis TaxID=2763673 RepID=A0ABR7NM28_9FIRM|nr:hypothetical protein [Yanshouia hominis]MBC8576703.1 hypothetical protein [Yanshouia hominis]
MKRTYIRVENRVGAAPLRLSHFARGSRVARAGGKGSRRHAPALVSARQPRSPVAEIAQACVEYLADYYAPDWNPWAKGRWSDG